MSPTGAGPYSVGPDCLGPAPSPVDAGEAWIRSASLWPSEPADLRLAFTTYFRAQSDVAARLLSIMAVALDLPVDHFAGLIDRHTSALRALHYRAIGAETPVGSLRAGAHSDYGTLTILRTDDVRGLEIRRPDGTWLEIVPRTDAFIVNLGDSIAQWTNDRWRSTVHRVTLVDPAPAIRSPSFTWPTGTPPSSVCHLVDRSPSRRATHRSRPVPG